jgi:hypothetical protein
MFGHQIDGMTIMHELPESPTLGANRQKRVVIERKADPEHGPGGKEKKVHVFERMQLLPEGGKR